MRAAIELKKAKVKGGETEEGYDAESKAPSCPELSALIICSEAARKEAKRRLKASKAAKHDLETKDVVVVACCCCCWCSGGGDIVRSGTWLQSERGQAVCSET